jgi:acyl CoA:acetate/3-ketoacid CoA transferase alpha subunit
LTEGGIMGEENVYLNAGQGPVRRIRLTGEAVVLVRALREDEAILKAKTALEGGSVLGTKVESVDMDVVEITEEG